MYGYTIGHAGPLFDVMLEVVIEIEGIGSISIKIAFEEWGKLRYMSYLLFTCVKVPGCH